MQPKFEAKASTDGATLDLMMYGVIGQDYYGDGSRIDARNVAKALNANKSVKAINLQINSGGGDFFHAIAIYSALKAHGAKIKGVIQGLAASAMTAICCACDEIMMADGSLYMIHEARTGVEGTVDQMQAIVDLTKKVNEQMVSVYASRTGQKPDKVASMMHDETWMTAEEAKANGFVNTVVPMKTMAAMLPSDNSLTVPEHIKPILALLNEGTAMTDPIVTPAVAPVVAIPAVVAVAPAAAPVVPAATPASAAQPAIVATDPAAAATMRANSIFAACLIAGQPEQAVALVSDPKETAETVLLKLQTAFIAERKPIEAGAANAGEPGKKDDNAKFAAEFDKDTETFAEMGVSKDQYIATRRRDEGLPAIVK